MKKDSMILNLRHAVFWKHVSKDDKAMKSRIPYVHADFKIFTHCITKKLQTTSRKFLILRGD